MPFTDKIEGISGPSIMRAKEFLDSGLRSVNSDSEWKRRMAKPYADIVARNPICKVIFYGMMTEEIRLKEIVRRANQAVDSGIIKYVLKEVKDIPISVVTNRKGENLNSEGVAIFDDCRYYHYKLACKESRELNLGECYCLDHKPFNFSRIEEIDLEKFFEMYDIGHDVFQKMHNEYLEKQWGEERECYYCEHKTYHGTSITQDWFCSIIDPETQKPYTNSDSRCKIFQHKDINFACGS
ncbi:MAG: hypothetical protein PHY32_02205 [Candidatus Pacebacteria bacterium]|nr:hypothetical protein [Candidatus Paceibacterota bacterium]